MISLLTHGCSETTYEYNASGNELQQLITSTKTTKCLSDCWHYAAINVEETVRCVVLPFSIYASVADDSTPSYG